MRPTPRDTEPAFVPAGDVVRFNTEVGGQVKKLRRETWLIAGVAFLGLLADLSIFWMLL